VPVARTAIGCLLAAAALVGLMLLVRPAIFSLAPPRDDTRVTVGSAASLAGGPRRIDVALARSYGLDGERPLDAGRVQVTLVVAPTLTGGFSVVNAASPIAVDCPIEIAQDRLRDCEGRAWAFDGSPIDAGLPPLQRFEVSIVDGSVRADLTRPID
jgi:hypothetical protein